MTRIPVGISGFRLIGIAVMLYGLAGHVHAADPPANPAAADKTERLQADIDDVLQRLADIGNRIDKVTVSHLYCHGGTGVFDATPHPFEAKPYSAQAPTAVDATTLARGIAAVRLVNRKNLAKKPVEIAPALLKIKCTRKLPLPLRLLKHAVRDRGCQVCNRGMSRFVRRRQKRVWLFRTLCDVGRSKVGSYALPVTPAALSSDAAPGRAAGQALRDRTSGA